MRPSLSYFRAISIENLAPHPAAAPAYILWLSIEPQLQPCPVSVLKTGESYKWFGGFSGLQTAALGYVEAQVFRKIPETFRDDAWREAASASAAGVNDYANWFQKLQLLLPEGQKTKLFGPRGLTKSSAAQVAGITRQTLHAALAKSK